MGAKDRREGEARRGRGRQGSKEGEREGRKEKGMCRWYRNREKFAFYQLEARAK